MRKIFFLLIFFTAFQLFAQEESFPCKSANNKLKELFSIGRLDNLYVLYVHGCSGPGLHKLSSSFLKPSGTPPEIIEDPDNMEPPDDTEYVNWTCKYSPGNLQDGNTATAWVDGVIGYGIGEVIIIPCLDLDKPIEIWTGYGKSENLFQYNSRPSKIKTIIIQSRLERATQYGSVFENLTVIKSEELNLIDKNGYQSISIPSFIKEKYFDKKYNDEVEYRYFLGVEILEVYKGSKWEDTCISEIRNSIN